MEPAADPTPEIVGLALIGLVMFVFIRVCCWKMAVELKRHRCHVCLHSWMPAAGERNDEILGLGLLCPRCRSPQ